MLERWWIVGAALIAAGCGGDLVAQGRGKDVVAEAQEEAAAPDQPPAEEPGDGGGPPADDPPQDEPPGEDLPEEESPATPECVPELARGDPLREQTGGAWGQLFPLPRDYVDPEPFVAGFSEGACQPLDSRPSLAGWCEEVRYSDTGVIVARARPPAPVTDSAPEQEPETLLQSSHPPGVFVTEYGKDGLQIRETRTYDDKGRVVEFKEEDRGTDHDPYHLTVHWRLHIACDGRPARYEHFTDWARAHVAYDAEGRLTLLSGSGSSLAQSFHPNGRLAVRTVDSWDHSTSDSSAIWYDDSGRLLGSMGSEYRYFAPETRTTLRDPVDGTVRETYEGPFSSFWTVTRFGRAEAGQAGIAWTTTKPSADAPEGRRSATRTTTLCGTSEPVKFETDAGADGTVEETVTYEWVEAERVIRRRSSVTDGWVDYRFACK